MKKLITAFILTACVMAFTGEALAQQSKTKMRRRRNPVVCSYTPLQEMVRSAQNEEEIRSLAERGVNLGEETRCGGNLLQLAIRRGNPNIVRIILEQTPSLAASLVPTDDFGDMPKTTPADIPLTAFAAYYAPNEAVMKEIIDNGGDIYAKDANENDIFWYMEQNPVLRKSKIADQIVERFYTVPQETVNDGKSNTPSLAAESIDSPLEEADTFSLPKKEQTKRRAPREIVEPLEEL